MDTKNNQNPAQTKTQRKQKMLNQARGYANLGHFLKSKPIYNALFEKEQNRSFELGYN